MIGRVAVLGAGAIGAVYARKFYAVNPTQSVLIAAGERAARLQREGVIINGERTIFPVVTPDAPPDPATLVIVALKHHQLADALPDLKPVVGDDTVILSVMNGLDSEAMIQDMYGDKALYGIAVGIDAIRTGNVIAYQNEGRIVFGEADNTTISERVQRVQQLFDHAGFAHHTPPDMLRSLWWKFMVNVGINQTSAILGAPYGVFQTSEHAQAIMDAAMREVIAVAQARGIPLGEQDIPDWHEVMHTLRADGKTSMLQDVEAGRMTEIEIFAGKMIAVGAEYGIAVPVNTVLYHAIKVLEVPK